MTEPREPEQRIWTSGVVVGSVPVTNEQYAWLCRTWRNEPQVVAEDYFRYGPGARQPTEEEIRASEDFVSRIFEGRDLENENDDEDEDEEIVWAKCAICKTNRVPASEGYDTCAPCLKGA